MNSATERTIGMIGNARLTLVGANLFLYVINHEGHFAEIESNLFPPGIDNSARFYRHDGTVYEFKDYGNLVKELRSNDSFNIEYLGMLVQTAFINIGDELSRNGYFDKAPVLEFIRHIRNALGHGNKFHFLGKEPSRAAELRGRALSKQLNGQQVFFDFMALGDAFDLLEDAEVHLKGLQ